MNEKKQEKSVTSCGSSVVPGWAAGMRHLDLFSGVGGFALAASTIWRKDYETAAFVERERFCQKVLRKNFPNTPILGDVRDCLGKDFGKIDLITGGFPCQPFSVAGKQKGKEDDRYLWPTMFEIIAQQRPTWIIGENVTGIIGMALDKVLADLESEGYATRTFIIPACAVNAPHRRDRVWIVAHSERERTGCEGGKAGDEERGTRKNRGESLRQVHKEARSSWTVSTGADASDTECNRLQRQREDREIKGQAGLRSRERCNKVKGISSTTPNPEGSEPREQAERERRENTERGSFNPIWLSETWGEADNFAEFPTQPTVCRRDDGVSDRVGKLKALGNAIVPQVAMKIMAAIRAAD